MRNGVKIERLDMNVECHATMTPPPKRGNSV